LAMTSTGSMPPSSARVDAAAVWICSRIPAPTS
jgi:hypothetical protein